MSRGSGNEDTLAAGIRPGNDPDPIAATERPGDSPVDATLPAAALSGGYEHLTTVEPGHYTDRAVLTSGGMGRIITAFDRRLKRRVAIKELRTQGTDLQARFEREAMLTARLQHPNIVGIHEAGRWPSGEPFYAMKLVAGRPFDKVIADAKTLDDRLALLPNVIAVADALAYAHKERVIHRDLKPANVMIGEFGETVVIDWGLGKDLDATEKTHEERPTAKRAEVDIGATAIGEVLGTPAYMPPEQAEGQAVDERADVYSIGAILYHLLAGEPPFTGKNSWEVVEAVIQALPTPLDERQPGVPADLLAVVRRAMAREPEDRYPTAKGLADDLKRYQSGQLVGAHQYSLGQLLRRWLRRHRTAIGVAVVAMVILLVVGGFAIQRTVSAQHRAEEQRSVAQAQRALAQKSRAQAEDLMSFMLVDLRDKLAPLGRLDLLEDVAKKAIAYYDVRGDEQTDAELRQRAAAQTNLGDVLLFQGHTDDALREYRASLAVDKMLAAKDPENHTWQRDVAVTHYKIGDVLATQGDSRGALDEYKASRTIQDALAAADPTNPELQVDVSIGRNRVGDVLSAQGDANGALVEYHASQAIIEALLAKDPSNLQRQVDLAYVHDRIGDVVRDAQRDSMGALAEYREAQRIDESVAAKDPTNANYQRDLAVGHQKIGELLLGKNDVAGALGEYRTFVAITEALAAKDPTNADRQRDLAMSHTKLADALATGDASGALSEYQAARTIVEALVVRDPKNARLQEQLAVIHQNIGDVRLAQGDGAGAVAEYRTFEEIVDKLVVIDPTNVTLLSDLAVGHVKLGDTLLAQGDAAGAHAAYLAVPSVANRLIAQDPNNTKWQAYNAAGHEKLGDALAAQGDAAGARAEYQAGLEIAQRLATKDASWTDLATELARKMAAPPRR